MTGLPEICASADVLAEFDELGIRTTSPETLEVAYHFRMLAGRERPRWQWRKRAMDLRCGCWAAALLAAHSRAHAGGWARRACLAYGEYCFVANPLWVRVFASLAGVPLPSEQPQVVESDPLYQMVSYVRRRCAGLPEPITR